MHAGGACAGRHGSNHRDWYTKYGILAAAMKTTIYLPDDLHRELKRAAKESGTSEAELIRTAVRHELLGAPPGQAERAKRRARLLAAVGKLDSSVYPSGYLDEVRTGWGS
ncbi:MAG: CopG family transcriptional regulator [Mycobacterium leprae]